MMAEIGKIMGGNRGMSFKKTGKRVLSTLLSNVLDTPLKFIFDLLGNVRVLVEFDNTIFAEIKSKL